MFDTIELITDKYGDSWVIFSKLAPKLCLGFVKADVNCRESTNRPSVWMYTGLMKRNIPAIEMNNLCRLL
ncbi:hypothetical protein KSF78_0005520 [Schistosoma japonicum]|nr:hypothetical protein KSF78_0005520 [Schistosoma japonicum]